jgi:hypothetical protein
VLAVDPAIPPGFIVQLPAGNPLNKMLPVEIAHVGWVIVPTDGADGVTGWGLITTFADVTEMQPAALVTV